MMELQGRNLEYYQVAPELRVYRQVGDDTYIEDVWYETELDW